MKEICERIISKLEDLSEHDDYGKVVDLYEAIDAIYEVANEYKLTKCCDCRYKHRTERNLWCDIFDKIMPENGYCCFGEELDGV